MATLSLCMIVKDEEGFLEKCISSVSDIVDEIIVVDTGSKDRTKEIAQELGAQVFDFKWKDDFSAARNFSLQKATSNWILVLDADEILDEKGREEILKIINNREYCLNDNIGFKLEQRTYLPEEKNSMSIKEIDPEEKSLSERFKGHKSSSLVRLFRNNPKIKFTNKVHELVEKSIEGNKGQIITTSIAIHHFSHIKKSTLAGKAERYTDLLWKQLEEDPEHPHHNRAVGLVFLEQGRKDLALKYLSRALQFDPNTPGIFADMGKLHVELNQPRRAIRFFNMALAKNKKDVSSLNNLAALYMAAGKLDVAEKLVHNALQIEPKNQYILSNKKRLDQLRGSGQ